MLQEIIVNLQNENRITFATFSLLTSRVDSYEVDKFLKNLDLVIIDEAHSSNAETYEYVIKKYLNLNANALILGLTATPYRSDDSEYKNLTCFCFLVLFLGRSRYQ